MNKKYENSIHRLGRIGVIIGICFMLGIHSVSCMAGKYWQIINSLCRTFSHLPSNKRC